MRRLIKTSPPPVLEDKAVDWTTEYETALSHGIHSLRPWSHQAVLDALGTETHGKCAYCEGVISDVSYPHVEHIIPKIRRPDLVVAWENLTLGCSVCNTRKGDYYDPEAALINPYKDDPLEHLDFRGPAIFGRLGSDMGARTVIRLNLMRGALLIERSRRLQALHSLLDRWARQDGPDRATLEEAIHDELADDREFVQTLRSHAASVGFPLVLPAA